MVAVWGELKRRNVVRVAVAYVIVGWLILQLTDVLVPLLSLPEWVGRLVFFLLLVGWPLALVFAWAFEITPQGLKKEKDVNRDHSITRTTGRRLDYVIIAVLGLALGYFAMDKFILDPSRDAELKQTTSEAVPTDKSIAVLAFVNMSADPDQEYFSDGISEELLNVLAKIPGLRVSARTSSFQFKGENRDAIDIGQQLNVGLVLEGSVRKAGDQIRITAQLIDASNGFHLWSESYDRQLANIFALQDEISAAIVTALKKHMDLQVEEAPPVIAAANTEAHEAYLRGRHLVVQRTVPTIEGAVQEFEKAIAFDPNHALAHAELAMATLMLHSYGLQESVTEAIDRAARHAKRAMALDPGLAEAHAATGLVLVYQLNFEEGLTHYRRAIQINPNYSTVYIWMGGANESLGRYAETFATIQKALRLDPLSRPARYNYIRELIFRNRLEEADREIEKFASIAPGRSADLRGIRSGFDGNWTNAVLGVLGRLRIDPRYSGGWPRLSRLLAKIGLEKEALAISEDTSPRVLRILGRPEDAVTAAEARLERNGRDFMDLGLALASAGDYARARPILEEMWQKSGGVIAFRGLFQPASAAALIAIRRDAGEETSVSELVAAIRDNVRRYHEAGITRADGRNSVDYEAGLAYYLSGERERGLALISKGVEDGWFIRPKEAYLQSLYDDPDFAPIRTSQKAHQAREREEILAVVCTDNPYVTVWQPAEGTCERFAAGGN